VGCSKETGHVKRKEAGGTKYMVRGNKVAVLIAPWPPRKRAGERRWKQSCFGILLQTSKLCSVPCVAMPMATDERSPALQSQDHRITEW